MRDAAERMLGAELSGRYQLTEILGRGGMGVVYRAFDPRLNRDVAIKMLPSLFLGEEAEERFQREAHLVAQLDHPAIVPIHDFGSHEGSLFFVMPMVHGTPLRALIRKRTVRLGEAIEVVIQAAEALDYSHARGVIHRDIKPENLMVTQEDGSDLRVRIMDFGLAVGAAGERLTKTGNVLGTMAYFSPEQATSADKVDGRSDLYSLGVVLYESLTGKPPFSGTPHEVLYRTVHELPEAPRQRGAEIDEELEAIILRCLAKDPEARPIRGAELSTALRAYLEELPAETRDARVLAEVDGETRPRPSRMSFIGRKPELGELQRRLAAALDGELQVVLIGGEAGAGKTRLVQEIETLAAARKVGVLRGRFAENEGDFPYQGFTELIQDALRPRERAGTTSNVTPPELADLAADLAFHFPSLSGLPAIADHLESLPRSTLIARSGEASSGERVVLFELIARTLSRLLGDKPAVLALENLHGADASIAALRYLVHRLATVPVLLVATFRTNQVGRAHPLHDLLSSLRDEPRAVHLELEPLAPGEHRELVESLVRSPNVTNTLAEQLYETTEGNPYFTVELVRSLIETGGISTQPKTGAWTLADHATLASESLPATIQQAVEKRLVGLPEELRRVLSIASVLGRSFDAEDLVTLTGGHDLDQEIEALLREGFLEEDRRTRSDRLAFTSSLVRDVLYGDLPRRRRRTLHRKHAQRLERRWAGRHERVYPQLVHHFSEGDEADKTVEYALRLIRQAIDAHSPDNAIRAAKIALDFVEDEDFDGPPALEGELRLLLATALRAAGQMETARREAGLAVGSLAAAREPLGAAQAALVAAETAWRGRQVHDTRRWVDTGIEIARGAQLPPGELAEMRDEILVKLLQMAATVANLRGEYEIARTYREEADARRPDPVPNEDSAEIEENGELSVALSNPLTTLDPAQAESVEDAEVLANIFDPLLEADAEGNLQPRLARAWEASDDGLELRFDLPPEARFSDGEPLTADAVKRSLERAARCGRRLLAAAHGAVDGWLEHAAGEAEGIRGLRSEGPHRLVCHLAEPLPFFPILLTDVNTAIVRQTEDGTLVGTGDFVVASADQGEIVLERPEAPWRRRTPRLARLRFHTGLRSAEISAGLRDGSLDVGRDLRPEDLDALLRQSRFQNRLVEALQNNVYFVGFHLEGPSTRHRELRRALAGILRVQTLVWRALGRYAQPASSLIPPHILGHDPGRRPLVLSRGEAEAELRAAGLTPPITLRAAVNPVLRDRYRALTEAILAEWARLGVTVEIVTDSLESYVATAREPAGLDLVLGRWNLDYPDPDSAAAGLVSSRHGHLGACLAVADLDPLIARAREERDAAVRQTLYRQLENNLAEESALVPLFYDIDYRLAGPRVRGLRLSASLPYVRYSELAKAAEAPAPLPTRPPPIGTLVIPLPAAVERLDPTDANFVEVAEAVSVVFETLTRVDADAQVVPALARTITAEDGGRRFRIVLRDDARFHDGRRLTARDVRWSFERLLRVPQRAAAWALHPVRGATAFHAGEVEELPGFRIVSQHELLLELERPMVFYPAILTHPTTAILPEGTTELRGHWREGMSGTGPYRVIRFDPGRHLELEANPTYWRPGLPRHERLDFRFGQTSGDVVAAFRAGELALAGGLRPEQIESLRQDPELRGGYQEVPGLSTYFLVLNSHNGQLRDLESRRALASSLDIEAAVQRHLEPLGIPATGVIPPGLLGHEGTPAERQIRPLQDLSHLDLTAWVHPTFFDQHSRFWESLNATFSQAGLRAHVTSKSLAELIEKVTSGQVDLAVTRWLADYPDADSFVSLAHTQGGMYGGMIGSPELDALIEKGRAEIDPSLRHAIYREIEQTLEREVLIVPLFHEQIYRFVRPEVHGLRLSFSVPEVAYEELAFEE